MWQFVIWVFLSLIGTAFTFVSGRFATDSWNKWHKQEREIKSDPLVEVKISKSERELLIEVVTQKHVATLAVDIPLLGKVISIHDYNPITDAQVPLKQITGSQTTNSQNNVEFLIENIKPNSKVSYKVIFEPMDRRIHIAGTDRYQISYTWNFEGNILSEKKWISFETGKEVGEPDVQVREFTRYSKALTADEIKKIYEQGPQRRKID